MSWGYTRAARAATSRQVKQELVRLLFGKQYARTGPAGHKKLDSAAYSYSELKRAYFARLQEIHPDKKKSSIPEVEEDSSTKNTKVFHELQEAWERYEEMAKPMEKVQADQTNFTKFGVGCSFSDSEQERALRTEITDQACRGWFSSGLLSAEESSSNTQSNEETPPTTPTNVTSLLDDNLFVEVKSSERRGDGNHDIKDISKAKQPPKTLIPNFKG
jgi:hypothetical protein